MEAAKQLAAERIEHFAREVDGFIELGMWSDAWNALEEIPALLRGSPRVTLIRLKCCPHVGAWEIGVQLAEAMAKGGKDERRAAGEFFFDLAEKYLAGGDITSAKEAALRSMASWPEVREAFEARADLARLIDTAE